MQMLKLVNKFSLPTIVLQQSLFPPLMKLLVLANKMVVSGYLREGVC